MKEAIQKAIEGGYRLKGYETYSEFTIKCLNEFWTEWHITTTYRDGKPFITIKTERNAFILLDPLFWQCLVKALGWEGNGFNKKPLWRNLLVDFIDWKAEGKDEEEFFKDLLET